MHILHNTYAVFWRTPGMGRRAFHADVARQGREPYEAVEAYRWMFPNDIVASVRDSSGRFLPFKHESTIGPAFRDAIAKEFGL